MDTSAPRFRNAAKWTAKAAFVFLTAVCCLPPSVSGETFPGVHYPLTTTFDVYPSIASTTEVARRSFTPLTFQRMQTALLRSSKRLNETPLQLSDEKYLLYVPRATPAQGYGLVVFVAPSSKPSLPFGWASVLDREGVILVSALNAGNAESILDRREPLALIAAANISIRFPVNPARVYVMGFSGGSRVAMRLALAYPDVFQAAILNSGSDPIGDPITPIPPQDLMTTFQERSRLLYLTGERDDINVSKDMESRQSMNLWCVFNTSASSIPQIGHDLADAQAFSHALKTLAQAPQPPSRRLEVCRAALMTQMQAKLDAASQLIVSGDSKGSVQLRQIDGRFGGLAAPRSLVLATLSGQ